MLASISAEAERLYTRLLLIADDYGRFEGDPRIVLSRCFPLRASQIPIEEFERWYQELQAAKGREDDETAIVLYEVSGRRFGRITKWKGTPRAKKSKYPDPSGSGDSGSAEFNFSNSAACSEAWKAGFKEFWSLIPTDRRLEKKVAWEKWKSLYPGPERDGLLLAKILGALQRHLASLEHPKYFPYPFRWLRDRRFEDEAFSGDTAAAAPDTAGYKPPVNRQSEKRWVGYEKSPTGFEEPNANA